MVARRPHLKGCEDEIEVDVMMALYAFKGDKKWEPLTAHERGALQAIHVA